MLDDDLYMAFKNDGEDKHKYQVAVNLCLKRLETAVGNTVQFKTELKRVNNCWNLAAKRYNKEHGDIIKIDGIYSFLKNHFIEIDPDFSILFE